MDRRSISASHSILRLSCDTPGRDTVYLAKAVFKIVHMVFHQPVYSDFWKYTNSTVKLCERHCKRTGERFTTHSCRQFINSALPLERGSVKHAIRLLGTHGNPYSAVDLMSSITNCCLFWIRRLSSVRSNLLIFFSKNCHSFGIMFDSLKYLWHPGRMPYTVAPDVLSWYWPFFLLCWYLWPQWVHWVLLAFRRAHLTCLRL